MQAGRAVPVLWDKFKRSCLQLIKCYSADKQEPWVDNLTVFDLDKYVLSSLPADEKRNS